MKLLLLFVMALLSLQSFGQAKGNYYMDFQPKSELIFNLNSSSFKKVNTTISKSKLSDFTTSGYFLEAVKYRDVREKAKKQLVNTFKCKETDLFIEKINNPYYPGEVIFGTNGSEASCIYIFGYGKGVYYVTMTFQHKQSETEKVDQIIASIKRK